MNKVLHIVISALLLLMLSGCNQFLGIKPKGFLIPETVAEYEYILNDPQLGKTAEAYPIFLTDDAYIPDTENTGYFPSMLSVDTPTRNLYTFQEEVFGPSEDDSFWTYSYNRIYSYNVVANNVIDATEATEAEKKVIRAEALVGRALEYLNLINAYAPHYDSATASSDLGVVIRLDEKIDAENLTRASVAEVYNQIISDLNSAIELLPVKPKVNAIRGSKTAGYGLLARTYLYMGDYKKALDNANASLKINNSLLNLNDYEVTRPNGGYGRNNVPHLWNNPENIYIRMAPWVFGISGQVYPSEELLSLFTDNDSRFRIYFTKKPFGIEIDHTIWLQYVQANLAITTPEIYLTAAECEARIGSKDKAMEYVNKLRDNRIVDNTPLVAADNDEALKLVLEERRRELAFLGPLRLFDLKRLNKDPRFAKTITRVVEGKTYTLKPNSGVYVLPIPPKVLRFNPEMKDNVRK